MLTQVVMLEPVTASIALYVALRLPQTKNKRRLCLFLKKNKKELFSTLVEEIAEPALDQAVHVLPSWASFTVYLMLWLIIWIT